MNPLLTILDTDSYKSSHFLQYPEGTKGMVSYIESRGGRYSSTVFFGLQYILKEYLSKPITMEMVEEAKTFFEAHGEPFPYDGWKYIATDLKGKLPILIRAAKEGAVIPTHNVLMTVESTDPRVFWVVTWVETMLMRVWYPTTVATQSWHIKKIIHQYLKETSENPSAELPFKLHDFGSRGVSSQESAAIGGASHLVNFMGSDTVAGVYLANKYYKEKMAGFSIPAAEHSTITSWGKEGELAAYRNMIKRFAKPGSLVAVVSDSYDLMNALEHFWGDKLRDEVINSGATIVIRPDSGDPTEMVLKTVSLLDEKYGSMYNNKGFKVLNNVRVIQGDGVNEESIRSILETLKQHGYSASNVAFGMGGALLQQVNRDTQRFAYKCSQITIGNKRIPVFKDPVTDPIKKSKGGYLDLIKKAGTYMTVVDNPTGISEMVEVFHNGEILREYTLEEVRKRSSES
jgi:nicotinamide phosphoribosyltransferase